MSLKAREYDARVARVIHDAGARIVDRGRDGSGHRTVTLCHHGQERTFHYASTGTSRGHGLRNMEQRLKWLLGGITPVATPEEPEPLTAIIPQAVTPVCSPNARRIVQPKPTRSEIIKHYIATKSIDAIMAKFDLTYDQAEVILLSTSGSVRTTYERERDVRRAALARKLRPVVVQQTQVVHPQPLPKTKVKSDPKRDKLIYTYHYYGMTLREVAEHFGLTHERVRQIVRTMEKLHDAG